MAKNRYYKQLILFFFLIELIFIKGCQIVDNNKSTDKTSINKQNSTEDKKLVVFEKDRVSFVTTGPAFAVPAVNEKFLFVGSGFSRDCQTRGELRAFDKNNLKLVWHSQVKGSIGDTTIKVVDDLVIFGSGDGVTALNSNNGKLLWHRQLKGCFQESFITVSNKKIYIGSSTGDIYSLNLQGEVLWQNKLKGSVFAAPPISTKNQVFFVDMKNNLAAIHAETGDIIWEKNLFKDEKVEGGFFSSPLIYNDRLVLTSRSGGVLILSLEGQVLATNVTKSDYIASPIICDGDIIVANLSSQVSWLSPKNLKPKHTLQLPGKFIFGTPQCQNDVVILTTYGEAQKPSILYFLKNGNIVDYTKLPCCNHALTTTIIDKNHVYNILTPYSSLEQTQYEIDLVRSRLKNRD